MDGFGGLFGLEEQQLGDGQRRICVPNLIDDFGQTTAPSIVGTHWTIKHDYTLAKEPREDIIGSFASSLRNLESTS